MNQHVGEVVEEGQRQVDGQKPEEALQDAGCPQVELAILPGRQNEAHHIPQFAALPVWEVEQRREAEESQEDAQHEIEVG